MSIPIGDTVNTACRVEAATRETGDDVLITEATLEPLERPHGSWSSRPAIPLRGKRGTVCLHAPGSPEADRSEFGASSSRARR